MNDNKPSAGETVVLAVIGGLIGLAGAYWLVIVPLTRAAE